MKKFLGNLFFSLLRIAFWFRYKIKVVGLENLNKTNLNKKGGVLFLPNHPAVFVDPAIISMFIWNKFTIRPLIVEYIYYSPVINTLMKMINALPIPDFVNSSNSLKKRKNEKAIQSVIEGIHHGDNFLIYPAGHLKNGNREIIGGASGVYTIVKNCPDANIVLVRIKGLYGSIFSRYFEGKTPKVFPTILTGIKYVLKNLIFFTPRRTIIVEYLPAPKDFPNDSASRLEFNRYLENWYNQPDGLTLQEGEQPGDSTVLISHSLWSYDVPERKVIAQNKVEAIDLSSIPEEVKEKVISKISEISHIPSSKITPEMDLATDLGLDSLDTAEIYAFLHEKFDVTKVPLNELTTVAKVIAIAARQVKWEEKTIEMDVDVKLWQSPKPHELIELAPGKTIGEVFLNNCERQGNLAACADNLSGILTYKQLKLRVILIADYIKNLPGKYIGILLPASVPTFVVILACEIAGKIPLPINWTLGPRHLKSILELTNVQSILSSWSFLDKLENVDLSPIEDKILMLEEVRRELKFSQKIKAKYLSMLSTSKILKYFKSDKLNENDIAVVLFTSGTENAPKGVPLSHKNILTNLEGGFKTLNLYQDDIMYGILPPFHTFGFTVTGLIGFLTGMKVVFYPNPNDASNLAKGIKKWGITIFCSAPSFIIKTLKAATTEQLQSIRLTVSGAEKAPQEMLDLLEKHHKRETFTEGYGITECSPILAGHHSGMPQIGIGKAIPNVELMIADENTFEPLPTGKRGMILARGPNIFSGYLNPGLASPFVTVEGKEWYKTGDLGFFDDQGFLTISGRLKRFVKIGGEMISLPAVEETINALVKEKKLEIPKNPNGEEVSATIAICAKEIENEKAQIYLFSIFDLDQSEVNDYLKMAGYSSLTKVAKVIKVDKIPLLGSGKTNYRALEETFLN